MKSLLLLALGLARTVVLGARIEAERIVVSVRPYKREQRRCPVCGRACDFYDMANRGAPRLWRAMDLARSACYLEYAPCRVRCRSTACAPRPSPGRGTGRASRATSRTGWRGWRSADTVNLLFTICANESAPIALTHFHRFRQRFSTVFGYSVPLLSRGRSFSR